MLQPELMKRQVIVIPLIAMPQTPSTRESKETSEFVQMKKELVNSKFEALLALLSLANQGKLILRPEMAKNKVCFEIPFDLDKESLRIIQEYVSRLIEDQVIIINQNTPVMEA